MFATYINCLSVIIGSLIGLLLKNRLKSSYREVVFTSSGLVTLVIGISMAMQTGSFLILIFSTVLGGFVGYALSIEDGVLSLGAWVESKLGNKNGAEQPQEFRLGFPLMHPSCVQGNDRRCSIRQVRSDYHFW